MKKILLIVIVIVLAGSGAFFSIFNESKIAYYEYTRFPAAYFNGKFITSYEFSKSILAVEKMEKNLTAEAKKSILRQMKQNILAENLLKTNNAKKYPIDEKYLPDDLDVRRQLQEYENLNALKTWFFSQESLNKKAYGVVSVIMSDLKNAEFQQVAKKYSDYGTVSGIDGDMGFVELSSLQPELKWQILNDNRHKNTFIAASRNGIHIIKYEKINENPDPVYHIYQIFIRGSDFDSWFQEKFKNIKDYNFIFIE